MSWRPYFTTARLALREAATYRLNHFLSFVVAVVPLIALLLLWNTLLGPQQRLAGFTRGEMLTYFILTRWLYEFTGPVVWWDIAYEIREGDLIFHLLRPEWYSGYHFALIIGSKLPYALVGLAVAAPFALSVGVGWVWPPGVAAWAAFALSVVLAVALAYQFTFLSSLTAFWLEDNKAMNLLMDFVVPLAAGALLPLDVFPSAVATALRALPFAQLLYFPALVYLGRVDPGGWWAGVAQQVGWLVALLVINGWVWRRGLRRFRAVGG